VSSDAEAADCPAPEKPKLPSEVWVLITANVVIALGYGVVAPVLPQYARDFGVSISAATFVITAFSLMRLLAAPASGLIIQKLGERRVYLSGLLIVAVSTGACAFAHTYWQLLLFRSLGGFGSAMFTVASLGLTIRISPPDARGRVAGMFASAFLVGSVCGPVLGSLTVGFGLAAPFAIYGVALLIAVAAAQAVEHVGLPEARLNLSQAAIYLARAPKSNASYTAISKAIEDVREHGHVKPPKSLRDGNFYGRQLGNGKGYIYPHNDPSGFEVDYLPDELKGRTYYEPSGNGEETAE